jgi:hypothetical protein
MYRFGTVLLPLINLLLGYRDQFVAALVRIVLSSFVVSLQPSAPYQLLLNLTPLTMDQGDSLGDSTTDILTGAPSGQANNQPFLPSKPASPEYLSVHGLTYVPFTLFDPCL